MRSYPFVAIQCFLCEEKEAFSQGSAILERFEMDDTITYVPSCVDRFQGAHIQNDAAAFRPLSVRVVKMWHVCVKSAVTPTSSCILTARLTETHDNITLLTGLQ